MIPAEKQKEFNQLVKIAIDYNKTELGDLAAYIEQSSSVMPPFHDDFAGFHRDICSLFRLPENWDAFEERLLDVLNKTVWHPDNHPPQSTSPLYYRHSFIQDLLNHKSTIFADIDVFMAHGFTETELWLALYNYHYYGYEYDNSSGFSKYIVNDAEKYLSSLDHNFADSDQFIKRLIGNKPALVDKFIDKLIQGSYAGENYIAELTPVKKDYLTINAAKHEDYLVSLLYFKYKDKNVDYKMTPYYLTDLLETNYPNKYNKEIEIYLKKRADEALNYQTQMYPSIFDRTLETLLRYNSAENAFSTTSNYLRKFKDIRPDSIKIWLKRLKKHDISLK